VVCDGAGNAEQSARKVIRNFQGLAKQAGAMEYANLQNWKSWTGMLDANLLDGHQCTFAAVAALADRIVGVNVGDGKIFKFSKGGSIVTLSHGSSKKRLGSGDIEPFPIHAPIQRGEIVAVMTDGAWTPLSQPRMANLFRQKPAVHPADLPERFLLEAGKHGRADDMTIVLLYY
jgi:hypothetical protein